MKRFFILLLLVFFYTAAEARPYSVEEIPNVQLSNRYKFTSNPDGILSQAAVARIDSICYDLRHRGIAQTAVVTVAEIDSDDVFEFAYELFSKWGVGSKSNSGIGILLVEEAREIRFVTGYGVEGALPDAICKRIQTQYMLPYFRNGDYSSGMVAGVEAIRSVLNGSELDAGGNDDYISSDDEPVVGIIAFFALMMIGGMIVLYLAIRASQKCPNCKEIALQKDSARVISRDFGATTYEDTYICAKCGTVVKRKRQDYDSSHNNRGGGGPIIMGGGGFGRGGGGSFGGGWGGGSFGGGGAGSRW
ncbi:MAG: TPM domain-containing protein [Alistipes sp.]|nr:TPM domain-containing protein [Alistipes sp.]